MLLIDKGYYDYDYESIPVVTDCMQTALTQEETNNKLARFGFDFGKKEMSVDELQEYAMRQEGEIINDKKS